MWELPCLVIFLLVAIGRARSKTLGFFVLLGNMSYSNYLLHPYVIHLIDRKIYPISEPGVTALFFTFLAYALCIVVAYVSWHLIEQTSQRYFINKFIKPRTKPTASQPGT